MLPGSYLQFFDVGYIQLLMKEEDGLGAQARYLQKLGQTWRSLCEKLLMRLYLACSQILLHLEGNGLSNARYRQKPLLPAYCADVLRQHLNGPCSLAVGYDLEAVLGMKLQQFSHLIKDIGNLAIFHRKRMELIG